jgi:hypothetical protein
MQNFCKTILFWGMLGGFMACNSPEQDGKLAADYFCKIRKIEQETAFLPNNNYKQTKMREKNLYFDKMNKIRKKYYKKSGGRMFDKKFEDAFEEGKMACPK